VGAIFSIPVHTGPGAQPSLLYNGYWVSPGGRGNAAEAWQPPNTSSTEVKDRVELFLHSPSGP